MSKERIYVCHTFYHVYVTLLKEFALPNEKQGGATIVLSKMSNDFGNLKKRLKDSGVFEEVLEYDEKSYTFFPELQKYKVDRNFAANLINRMIFTKKLAKFQEPYVPVDFKEYRDVYVFCDSDPIGYYLNYKKIKYHAVEDGLNSLVHVDAARYDNRGNFAIKALLAKHNLLFIQNGYSKHCVDMEVNQIEGIKFPIEKHVEVPRKQLQERLTKQEKVIITNIFVKKRAEIEDRLNKIDSKEKTTLILTEPLCSLEVRKKIFKDLAEEYEEKGTVIIKPHPRDELDYEKEFSEYVVIEKMVPMEVLSYVTKESFDRVVSVLTDLNGVEFATEKIRLGADFMDKYEEPEIHRQNEQI